MNRTSDEPHLLVDIAKPVVTRPKASEVYSSPIGVAIDTGSDGHYVAKEFEIDFHPVGPELIKDRFEGHFTQELPPGPHELHTRGRWYSGSENEQSPWVFIEWFYVLTPPRPD